MQTDFFLNDNATQLQLRWIQRDAPGNPAWFIDEIFVDCYNLIATIAFEEEDRLDTLYWPYRFPSFNIFITRTFHNFWECSSGSVETGNTDCVQGSTSSHLLMDGTEREARTRIFNISSSALSHSNSDAVYSCRGACTNMAMYVTLYTHVYTILL